MLQFPIQVTTDGSPASVDGLNLLIQNLQEIFCIPLGTDFFQGQRGSRLHLLRGERDTSVLKGLAITYCKEVFEQSEVIDLAEFIGVDTKQDYDKMIIKVLFRSKITGQQGSFDVSV